MISFTIKTQRKVIIQLIMQKREWTEYLQLHLTWTKMGIVCLSYQDVLQWNRNFNLREISGLYKNQRYWTMIRRKEKRKSRILDSCYFFLIYRWTFKRAKYKRKICTCKIRPSWCYTPNHWLKKININWLRLQHLTYESISPTLNNYYVHGQVYWIRRTHIPPPLCSIH